MVFTFLFPIISFHPKYHTCVVDTSRIHYFLRLNSLYIHLPAEFLLRQVGGNMLLNVIGRSDIWGKKWFHMEGNDPLVVGTLLGIHAQTAVNSKTEL